MLVRMQTHYQTITIHVVNAVMDSIISIIIEMPAWIMLPYVLFNLIYASDLIRGHVCTPTPT